MFVGDIQKLVDAIGAAGRQTRSGYHLTLKRAIDICAGQPRDMVVRFDSGASPHSPHSYRGYYSDLSFKAVAEPVTVEAFEAMLRDAHGRTFEGYKGGDFTMGDDTPLWVAEWGSCGLAIIAAVPSGDTLTLITKQID